MRRKKRGGRGRVSTKKTSADTADDGQETEMVDKEPTSTSTAVTKTVANAANTATSTSAPDDGDAKVNPPSTTTTTPLQVQDQSIADAEDKSAANEAVNVNNTDENTMDMDKCKSPPASGSPSPDTQSSSVKFVDAACDADFTPPPPSMTMHGLWGNWCRFSTALERHQLYEKMDEDVYDFLQPILEDSIVVFENIYIENRDLQKEVAGLLRYLKEYEVMHESMWKNQAEYDRTLNKQLKRELDVAKSRLRDMGNMYNSLFLKYQQECLDNKKLEFQSSTVKVEYEMKVKDLEVKLEDMMKKKDDKNLKRKCKTPQTQNPSPKEKDLLVMKATTTTKDIVEKSIFDDSFDGDDDNGSFIGVLEKAIGVGESKKDELESSKNKKKRAIVDFESEMKEAPTITTTSLEHKDKRVPGKSSVSPPKTGKNKKVLEKSTESLVSPLKNDKSKDKIVPEKSAESLVSSLKNDKSKDKIVPEKSAESLVSSLMNDKSKDKKVPEKSTVSPVSPLKTDKNKKVLELEQSTESPVSPLKNDKNKGKKVPAAESPVKTFVNKKVIANVNESDGEIDLNNPESNIQEEKEGFFDDIFAQPQTKSFQSLFTDDDDEQSDDFTTIIKTRKSKREEREKKVSVSQSPSPSSSSIYKTKLRGQHSTLALSESETDNELNSMCELSPLKISRPTAPVPSPAPGPFKKDKNKNKKVPEISKESSLTPVSPLKNDKNNDIKSPAKSIELSPVSPLKKDKHKDKKVPESPPESLLKNDKEKKKLEISKESLPVSLLKNDKNKNKKVPEIAKESPPVPLLKNDTNKDKKSSAKSIESRVSPLDNDKNKEQKVQEISKELTPVLLLKNDKNNDKKSVSSNNTPVVNDIYLSRKARRDQILNESPQHIKRKDSIQSISNQIIKPTSSNSSNSYSVQVFNKSSSSTLGKKSTPVVGVGVGEKITKSRHQDQDEDRQEAVSGIKRIRTQAQKVQSQSKKGKSSNSINDSLNESIEAVVNDNGTSTRVFEADPDAGLYENNLKRKRVSHHHSTGTSTETTTTKDKDKIKKVSDAMIPIKKKVKSVAVAVAVPSILNFDKDKGKDKPEHEPESGLGYENGDVEVENITTERDSCKKLKLDNELGKESKIENVENVENDSSSDDDDLSELVIVQDYTGGQNDSVLRRNREEPTKMDIEKENNGVSNSSHEYEFQVQPTRTPVHVLLTSDKNEDLELEQGEISDSDNSDMIESPAEPTDHQDNDNTAEFLPTKIEPEPPGKKWTDVAVGVGRSGVGQMIKRCQFMIGMFMELPLNEIKKGSNEVLSMIKKNGVLPSKVHLAKCINDYILFHGHEELGEIGEDELPLSITYGKILSMIDLLRTKLTEQYHDLPSLIVEYFATQLVPNSRKWNDEHLVNYGRLFGAICRKYFDTERGINLLFQFLYWSPPHTFAFGFGFLSLRPETFAHFTFEKLSLRGKAVSFALIKPPLFYTAKYFNNIRSFFTQSIKFILPEMVFDQMVAVVVDALKLLEHDTVIREAGKTLAMMFMQCDWEGFLKFVRENLTDIIKIWRANSVSDAILAAFIRMIGDVCNDRIDFKDMDTMLQTIEAFMKLDPSLRTPILTEAIDTSIMKIQAKKRLMNQKGSGEISWEFKKIPAKKSGKKANAPKRASLKKRRRAKQKRAKRYAEKAKTQIGLRKRKKEMLRAAEELLAVHQDQEKHQVKTTTSSSRGKVEKPSASTKGIIDVNSNGQSAGQSQIINKDTVKGQINSKTRGIIDVNSNGPSAVVKNAVKEQANKKTKGIIDANLNEQSTVIKEQTNKKTRGIIDANSNGQTAGQSQIINKNIGKGQTTINKKTPAKVEEKRQPEPVVVDQQPEDLPKTRGKTRASATSTSYSGVSKVKLPDTSRNRLLKKVAKDLPASHPVKVHYRNKKAKLAQK